MSADPSVPLRALPISFAIVGAQKAATSTLYTLLAKHRLVARGRTKECHYFDDEKRDWDAPDYREFVIETHRRLPEIGGDATPIYLFWPHALERMRAYNPEMKLIASFRDPIERAFSQWSMERGRDAQYPDFGALVREPQFPSLPDALPPDVRSGTFRKRTVVARGFYGQQLRRGLESFPAQQWLLVEFRSFLSNHNATLDRVTDFLGIHRFRKPPPLVQRNPSPREHTGAPPTGDDIAALAELYADDLADFRTLSGLDVAAWPTARVIAGTLDPAEFAEKLARKAGLAP